MNRPGPKHNDPRASRVLGAFMLLEFVVAVLAAIAFGLWVWLDLF